ncbi:hypothetical protein QYF36_006101 [Acer negundo]|nr:hypothetical protein QYF36_006101 [Acer negundo]
MKHLYPKFIPKDSIMDEEDRAQEIIEAVQRGLSLENVGRVRKKGQEKWLQLTSNGYSFGSSELGGYGGE